MGRHPYRYRSILTRLKLFVCAALSRLTHAPLHPQPSLAAMVGVLRSFLIEELSQDVLYQEWAKLLVGEIPQPQF
jgi:hypothetical protein